MVPAAVVDASIARARAEAPEGGHPHRRRQLVLHRRHPRARTTCGPKGIHYVDVGTSRRRLGPRARLLHDDRRRRGRGRAPRPDLQGARAGPRRHRRARRAARRPAAPPRTATSTAGPPGPATSSRWSTTASSTGSWPPTPRGSTSSSTPTSARRQRDVDAETTPLRNPEHYQYDLNLPDVAEVWRRGSVIASWLLDLTAIALLEVARPRQLLGPRLGLRRRPLDDPRRDRRGHAGRGPDRRALRALRLAGRGRLREQAHVGDALRVRRPRREEGRRVADGGSPRTLAVDIGGTGIKTIVLDAAGKPLTERLRVDTPRPATPRAILAAIVGMAKQQGAFDRVSVGFPGVVRRGVTETAWNLDRRWIGFDLDSALQKALRKPVRCGNDADVQGLGVVRRKGRRARDHARDGLRLGALRGRAARAQRPARPSPAWRRKTYEEELGAEGPREGRAEEVEPAAPQGDRVARRRSSTTTGSTSGAATPRRSRSTCRRGSGSSPTSPG